MYAWLGDGCTVWGVYCLVVVEPFQLGASGLEVPSLIAPQSYWGNIIKNTIFFNLENFSTEVVKKTVLLLSEYETKM